MTSATYWSPDAIALFAVRQPGDLSADPYWRRQWRLLLTHNTSGKEIRRGYVILIFMR